MKKTYQTPSTEVLVTMAQTLMAGSIEKYSSTASDESKLLSRERNSVWDDEEDY